MGKQSSSLRGPGGSKRPGSPGIKPQPGTGHSKQVKWGDYKPLLDDVTNSLDNARFSQELLEQAEKLHQIINSARNESEPDFWDSLSVLAEVYDHFGERTRAEEVTQSALELKRELGDLLWEPGAQKDTKLRLAQMRHVLFWGQTVYRKQEFEQAEEIIMFCKRFVRQLIKYENNRWPHFKTQGLIAYFLGRVYRHQNRLEEAVAAFEESINFYYQRARDRNTIDASAYSHYRVAKALALGIGWVKLARGQYREALRQNLIPASVMLTSTKDDLNKYRVLLLEATAECALSGIDADKLKAVGKLKEAKKAFEHHPHYKAKAARELCLAYIDLRRFTDAEEEIEDFAGAKSGSNWKCQQQILLSLVDLGIAETVKENFSVAARHAMEHANTAHGLAKHVLDQSQSLIALGRARFAMHEYEKAESCFTAAHQLCMSSHSVEAATCYLYLARTFAKLNNFEQANSQLELWRKVEDATEHEGLRALARTVVKEVSDAGAFVIGRGDPFLDFRGQLHQLRRFLYARAQTDKKEEDVIVARKLGLTAIGLRGWRGTFRREAKVLESLKELCAKLESHGDSAVQQFERLIDSYGAYTACRRILRGSEDDGFYSKIFHLASNNVLVDFTVEQLVVNNSGKDGLFTTSEKQRAEERLRAFRLKNR